MTLDMKSISWGVLFSVLVNGSYETIKSLIKGDVLEETAVFVATVFLVMFLMFIFRKDFFKKEK